MKLLILIACFFVGAQSLAFDQEPQEMTPQQQARLIQALNQLDPEVLDSLLSDEGLEWYSRQFQRNTEPKMDDDQLGRIEFAGNPYNDPNAPTL